MDPMRWTITFPVIAIVAAIIGIGGFAGGYNWIANTLFVVFLLLAVIGMILYWKPSRRI